MLDNSPPRQADAADLSTYPREGVKVAINQHPQTLGNHRFRVTLPPAITDILRRGIYAPRVHIEGSVVNGFRIWCSQEGGLAPVLHRTTKMWTVTIPVRRTRAREQTVHATPVAVAWELDETGPVLLIPRLPDAVLPEPVIDRLPNSAVDPETRHDRANKALQREMQKLFAEAPTLEDEAPEPAPAPPIEPPAADAPPADPAPVDPPSPPAADLKEALQMVNELLDQLGDSVALSIDERGHVRAQRRIIQFIDL